MVCKKVLEIFYYNYLMQVGNLVGIIGHSESIRLKKKN